MSRRVITFDRRLGSLKYTLVSRFELSSDHLSVYARTRACVCIHVIPPNFIIPKYLGNKVQRSCNKKVLVFSRSHSEPCLICAHAVLSSCTMNIGKVSRVHLYDTVKGVAKTSISVYMDSCIAPRVIWKISRPRPRFDVVQSLPSSYRPRRADRWICY